VVIKDRVIVEMAGTKGVPRASWRSLRRDIAGCKQVMVSFKRISETVGCRGILMEVKGEKPKATVIFELLMWSCLGPEKVRSKIPPVKVPRRFGGFRSLFCGVYRG
jgi:hypothetical protein